MIPIQYAGVKKHLIYFQKLKDFSLISFDLQLCWLFGYYGYYLPLNICFGMNRHSQPQVYKSIESQSCRKGALQ